MSKQAFFIALVVGLLANLAFVTSSQAGSTTITVNSALPTIPADVTSISGVDVTFSGVSSFTDLTVLFPKGSSVSVSGSTVDVSISSKASDAFVLLGQAMATFSFSVPTSTVLGVAITSTEWQTNAGAVAGISGVMTSVGGASVPEPASMSLLGIGMAGLFAFRRYFRRTMNVQS
jgi:hypothetical protein